MGNQQNKEDHSSFDDLCDYCHIPADDKYAKSMADGAGANFRVCSFYLEPPLFQEMVGLLL